MIVKFIKDIYNDLGVINKILKHLASEDQQIEKLKIVHNPKISGLKPWKSNCVIGKMWVDK